MSNFYIYCPCRHCGATVFFDTFRGWIHHIRNVAECNPISSKTVAEPNQDEEKGTRVVRFND